MAGSESGRRGVGKGGGGGDGVVGSVCLSVSRRVVVAAIVSFCWTYLV